MSVDLIRRFRDLKKQIQSILQLLYRHASRHGLGAEDQVNIDASQIVSGTIDIARLPSPIAPTLVGYDNSEVTVTDTSYPQNDIKSILLSNQFGHSKSLVVIEAKVSSGDTLTVGIFRDGNLYSELSFNETSYVVKNVEISVSDVSPTSSVQIGIRMKVTGGTGYQRLFHVYLKP